MAKKKTNKPQQPISPKKYIMEAARKLPVFECVINEGWQEGGIAQIMVARQKQHGNLLVGIYIVDVFCLGLKNTLFYENLSPYEYETQKVRVAQSSEQTWEKISPNTCFNIIYGAIEYAEDLGFQPNKDFNVTEYILDGVEKIKFEEIEFGQDGKPFYFAGPYDDSKKVLSTLKRSVGEGNFHYVAGIDLDGSPLKPKYDREASNDFGEEDDDDEFIDDEPSINMLLDFKEEIDNPKDIVEMFVKKHESSVNLSEDGNLPFIYFYPNEEEMEQKHVDKDMIKAITSFFKDNYLQCNSINISIRIIAQALILREDELFDGLFDEEFAELNAINNNLENYLAHFPEILKDKGVSNCIKNNHLFAYIEKVYQELKNMPLIGDYSMKLSVMLSEEDDTEPMYFEVSLCIENGN